MKRQPKAPIQHAVLRTLITVGVLGAALIVPHVVAELKKLDPAFAKQKNVRRRIQETLWRMERSGMVSLPKRGTLGRVELLPKGRALIEKIKAEKYTIRQPLLWDGKWRLVMFDVPEPRKSVRNQLRLLLQSAGLVRLHDSVWVHPYPCDELVTLVKAHLKNTKGEIHYFTGNLIESDKYLRDMFDL